MREHEHGQPDEDELEGAVPDREGARPAPQEPVAAEIAEPFEHATDLLGLRPLMRRLRHESEHEHERDRVGCRVDREHSRWPDDGDQHARERRAAHQRQPSRRLEERVRAPDRRLVLA